MKNFTLSKKLTEQAKKLKIPPQKIVKTSKELVSSILCENWRHLPNAYDVPANSQIFGHLIYSAGVEGILYPSKLNQKLCLAIFPENFKGTDSYLALDDEPPHPLVPTKIDGINWRVSELNPSEIMW
jgi:hypothetical protein